jgi:hypothetical protein
VDEKQYFWRDLENRKLRDRELRRRLRHAWTDLGHPEWADVITPALRDDALQRLRALRWTV